MKHDRNPSTTELDKLIELYFDCRLSESEERMLRRVVAATTLHSEAIDEARAVMGLAARDRRSIRRISSRRAWMSIAAAAAAVAALVGGYRMYTTPDIGGDCYAYVNGQRIDNRDIVTTIVENDLQALRDANAAIDNDVDSQLETLFDLMQDI